MIKKWNLQSVTRFYVNLWGNTLKCSNVKHSAINLVGVLRNQMKVWDFAFYRNIWNLAKIFEVVYYF